MRPGEVFSARALYLGLTHSLRALSDHCFHVWLCEHRDPISYLVIPISDREGVSTDFVRNPGLVCTIRELGVAGLTGAVGDLFSEAGFFETDFSVFNF